MNEQIVVTHPSTSILAISSGLSCQCGDLTTFSNTAPYPNGFSGYMTVNKVNLTLILSVDSNSIQVVNPTNSACNGNVYQSAAIKQFGNTMAIAVLILIGLTKTVFSHMNFSFQ